MVGTVRAIAVAMAPVTKMETRMTHMISCSDACERDQRTASVITACYR